jgi:hypothetical protein
LDEAGAGEGHHQLGKKKKKKKKENKVNFIKTEVTTTPIIFGGRKSKSTYLGCPCL